MEYLMVTIQLLIEVIIAFDPNHSLHHIHSFSSIQSINSISSPFILSPPSLPPQSNSGSASSFYHNDFYNIAPNPAININYDANPGFYYK